MIPSIKHADVINRSIDRYTFVIIALFKIYAKLHFGTENLIGGKRYRLIIIARIELMISGLPG